MSRREKCIGLAKTNLNLNLRANADHHSSYYAYLPTDPGGGEGVFPIMAYTGRLHPKGVTSGIWWKGRGFTHWGIWKGGEIFHLGLWQCSKGRTDEFYGFIKSGKRSIFVIDSYLNDNAL